SMQRKECRVVGAVTFFCLLSVLSVSAVVEFLLAGLIQGDPRPVSAATETPVYSASSTARRESPRLRWRRPARTSGTLAVPSRWAGGSAHTGRVLRPVVRFRPVVSERGPPALSHRQFSGEGG